MKAPVRLIRLSAMCVALGSVTACNAQSSESAAASPAAEARLSEAGLELAPLTITSGDQTHRFTVELAQSPEQQARGMMFRTELAPDKGMLFPFPTEKMASFWMKNTVIPLDIIFIRSDGTIESIAARATPYSLEPVQSGEPVAAVLELAGGRAAELSLQPGDRVDWLK
ncbi:DUF192 domain-containing protein [Parasphingorhabdus marina]|nr:DUF192 domain-containing protein [Parasphingorhabdus marina]